MMARQFLERLAEALPLEIMMPFCQACGNSVNSDARFCNSCGKPANIAFTAIPSVPAMSAAVALPIGTYSAAPTPAAVEPTTPSGKRAIRRHRPTGVIILAVIAFLGALPAASLGVVLLGYAASARAEGSLAPMQLLMRLFPVLAKGQQDMVNQASEAGIAMFLIAAVCAVLGYGLFRLRKWGRILAVAFSVLTLLRAMVLLFNSNGVLWNLFVIGISIWIITYLIKPRVKEAFDV
jgi:hypothetical protein